MVRQGPFYSGTGGHPQVVQAAGHFHGHVYEARTQVAKGVGDDAATLDPTDSVLDTHAQTPMTMGYWDETSKRGMADVYETKS